MSKNNLQRKKRLEHWQVIAIILAFYDVVVVNGSYFLALLLRFDFRYSMIEAGYLLAWEKFTPFYTIACLITFYLFHLYQSLWRFASYSELVHVLGANAVTCLIHVVCITVFIRRMPISYYIVGAFFQLILVLGIRFSYRFVLLLKSHKGPEGQYVKPVILIGAGNAGQMILRDIQRSKELGEKVVCFIDDNPNKWNRYVEGVPVVGGREEILSAVQKYKVRRIYLAIPSASASQKRDLLNVCKETGCEVKQLPSYTQLASGEVRVSQMKDVAVEDLLGREPIKADMTEVYAFIHDKVVLVTGGGGSIGSELCRQVASHHPRQLIIFDIYENNAYSIQLELREKYPDLDLVVLIGSVRDSRKVFDLFEKYRPQIVYHAAAHKHVPLMEDSPCEAIKNNVIGTYKVAYAAMMYGTQRFVLISTDKAVNPTNIMGASKRLCELVIQSFDKMIKAHRECEIPVLHVHQEDEDGSMYPLADGIKRCDEEGNPVFVIPGKDDLGHKKAQTEFIGVRFGNVLGSNGSVIPLFKDQIASGGPVTVTHPDIIRYFMTIPEAASLVLQAGAYAKGGELFILDMGEPVRIVDLAKNLIRLSGYEPDVDIKIEYTGLRPGEKLYEEKLMSEEGLTKTPNKLIHIGKPVKFDETKFLGSLNDLMTVAYENSEAIRLMVEELVDTYHPSEVISEVKKDEYRKVIKRIINKGCSKRS